MAHGHARLRKCPLFGKARFRDKTEAVVALHRAVAIRKWAEQNGEPCRRQECRAYRCSACHGWHLTSQERQTVAAA